MSSGMAVKDSVILALITGNKSWFVSMTFKEPSPFEFAPVAELPEVSYLSEVIAEFNKVFFAEILEMFVFFVKAS
jgi:hypothetical protein